MNKENAVSEIYIFKYFRIFIYFFAGHCTVRFLFQQHSSEIMFAVGASLFAAFFWWLYDWTASREKE